MFMKIKNLEFGLLTISMASLLALGGCGKGQGDVAAQEAPPPANIIPGVDVSDFSVEHPEQYPIVTATQYQAPSELIANGVVLPDIARTVPVITLASGRVVDIRARLGDTVQKDQVLLRVRSDDVAGGFDAYRKAVSDELLARKQLDRTKDLFEHGAMAQQDLEVAQDTEDDAKTTLETATEHLRLLGNDPDKPNGIVDILAPISGVITDQEVTNAASVQAYSSPNPFTISDLTTVWIVCDVFENDLANVRLGEPADIKLTAYPGRVIKGKISNIGSILDPNIRTAKVRIEVPNPGRDDAAGHVRHGHLIQQREAYLHVRAGIRDPAFARSRLGLHSYAREIPPNRSYQRRAVAEPDARNPHRSAAGPAGRVQCGHYPKCNRQ